MKLKNSNTELVSQMDLTTHHEQDKFSAKQEIGILFTAHRRRKKKLGSPLRNLIATILLVVVSLLSHAVIGMSQLDNKSYKAIIRLKAENG